MFLAKSLVIQTALFPQSPTQELRQLLTIQALAKDRKQSI
jgi:hypothetical protein